MAVYFAFNDDNGAYNQDATARQVKAHPFYIRATLIVNGDEYKKLHNKVQYQRRKLGLPGEGEIKWSYCWSLRRHEQKGEKIPETRDYYFLKDIGHAGILHYIDTALAQVGDLIYKKIVLTITRQKEGQIVNSQRMLEMHLETHMQRVNMETVGSDLSVIFMDPCSESIDRNIRAAYRTIRRGHQFAQSMGKVKDSLNFEDSEHSIGIQLADYIGGAFSARLKAHLDPRFKSGMKIFQERVRPFLRNNGGIYAGYGICEVPTNKNERKWLGSILAGTLR